MCIYNVKQWLMKTNGVKLIAISRRVFLFSAVQVNELKNN